MLWYMKISLKNPVQMQHSLWFSPHRLGRPSSRSRRVSMSMVLIPLEASRNWRLFLGDTWGSAGSLHAIFLPMCFGLSPFKKQTGTPGSKTHSQKHMLAIPANRHQWISLYSKTVRNVVRNCGFHAESNHKFHEVLAATPSSHPAVTMLEP